jgi:hypothetical protein
MLLSLLAFDLLCIICKIQLTLSLKQQAQCVEGHFAEFLPRALQHNLKEVKGGLAFSFYVLLMKRN